MKQSDPQILVVEDDPISRQLLKAALKKMGYQARIFGDSKKALEVIDNLKAPSLIILDWIMPHITGIDICRAVRQKKIPVHHYLILLSGKTGKQDIKEGLDAGADDYILKPFDPDELSARIGVGTRMLRLQQAMIEQERLQGVLEMAATICHEINQPLMTLSGLSELLLMDAGEIPEMVDTATKMKAQVDRLGTITRKLMNITRYETTTYLKRNMIDIDKASLDNNILK